jgi:hypothetical protein
VEAIVERLAGTGKLGGAGAAEKPLPVTGVDSGTSVLPLLKKGVAIWNRETNG